MNLPNSVGVVAQKFRSVFSILSNIYDGKFCENS